MNIYKPIWREFLLFVVLILYLHPLCLVGQSGDSFGDFGYYLHRGQDESLSVKVRKKYLEISHSLLKHTIDDSLKYSKMSDIATASANLQDSALFHGIVAESFQLAKDLGNPFLLGDVHWNYGAYYLRAKRFEDSYSHYNSAYKYFMEAEHDYYSGKMLYNMAYISSQTNDYTGAEILLFRCLKLFEDSSRPKQRYLCYNLLGTIADDMEEYEKGLAYYMKAAQLLPHFDGSDYYRLENWNNLGVRLIKMERYAEALPYFNKALAQTNILATRPSLHAKLLDNRAFCLVSLGRQGDLETTMHMAMELRDSIGDTAGSVISRLRFANYYGKTNDTVQALLYAHEALRLSQENFLTRDVLDALEVLAILDNRNAVSYLEQHIAVDKRLHARDRNLRNKFTAIQYETDKYIRENEKLFQQRLWISIVAVASIFILFLIYMNSRQRSKNKELLFEREQQQYNEDMFLMALSQKANLEKGRSEERQRISQELHDGIVSRLFSLRFRWQSVVLSGEASMIAKHKEFLALLEVLETNIRNLSHDLRNVVFVGEESFLDTIETVIKEKSEIGGFRYRFLCPQRRDWEDLSYLRKINLRRLVQEILQNVVKHSQAKWVTIKFYRDLDTLHLSICDNGKGFRPAQVRKGIGIKNLENRTRKLKGNFEVRSKIGVGTIVHISFPFNYQ